MKKLAYSFERDVALTHENNLYKLITQIALLADGLRENRPVESFTVSLLLESIINQVECPDFCDYHHNQQLLQSWEDSHAMQKWLEQQDKEKKNETQQ
ncbi:MAG: hypothetical protein KGV56_00125 [Gammaproteobacteria bacterium]|nr:hypothetical protein [Gammaproteobacteria bacterium]